MSQRQTATHPTFVSPETFLRENRGVVGRTLFYDAIRRGEVPHVRIGRRILALAAKRPTPRAIRG